MLWKQIGKASLTSGSLYIAGDIVNQKFLMTKKPQQLDWRQTARFGVVGAMLHGPYFLFGFKGLDKVFGTGREIRRVLIKSISGQCLVFPPFVVLMLSFNALLKGESPLKVVNSNAIPIFLNGFYCWPVVNVITFRFVPTDYRILWINAVGLVWNSYLAWQIGHQQSTVVPPPTTEEIVDLSRDMRSEK